MTAAVTVVLVGCAHWDTTVEQQMNLRRALRNSQPGESSFAVWRNHIASVCPGSTAPRCMSAVYNCLLEFGNIPRCAPMSDVGPCPIPIAHPHVGCGPWP